MTEKRFQELPRPLLETKRNHRLFEVVADGIREQVEDNPYEVNPKRLAQVPIAAQTIYWLWRFQCEAGICGIDVFALNSLGIFAPQIHGALEAVGAGELAHLLEAAVSLARDGPAEFKSIPDQSWFNHFPSTSEFAALHLINQPASPLVDALSDLAAAYIRANDAILFESS